VRNCERDGVVWCLIAVEVFDRVGWWRKGDGHVTYVLFRFQSFRVVSCSEVLGSDSSISK